MNYTLKRHIFSSCFASFLILHTLTSVTLPVYAKTTKQTDTSALPTSSFVDTYTKEAEDRKSLPIASNSYENWPAGEAIGAESAILMDADSGAILYEKNIHEKLYPASTTKILTCLIASEKCKLNDVISFSKDAVYSVPSDGSSMGMDTGQEITAEQCLYGILVGSANEAANAIAEHISGSVPAFAKVMNEKAAELGCVDSHFANPNGLHKEDHYTSAYDLAMIGRAFFANDMLCKMSSTSTYHIAPSAKQPDDIYVHSKNKLYEKGEFPYEYLVGSKTGFTDQARQTLVSCAEKNGMKLICVIMKEESPAQFTDTITLFNYGFDNFKRVNISDNETKYTVDNSSFFQTNNDIFGNSTPILSLDPSDCIILPNTASFSDVKSDLKYDKENNATLATINYTYNGVFVGTASVTLNFNNSKKDSNGNAQTVDQTDSAFSDSASNKEQNHVVIINVKYVICWTLGIAGTLIIFILIFSFLHSYQFARRRRTHSRRKKVTRTKLRFKNSKKRRF